MTSTIFSSLAAAFLAAPLAAAFLLAAPSAVLADPQMQLEQCIGLDRGELARAIDDELASSLPSSDTSDLVISASCDDGVSATVRITERGSKRRAERALALGEVTSELRPRLVALVAVELAEAVLAAPPAPAAVSLETAHLPATPPAPPAAEPGPAVEAPPGLWAGLRLTAGDKRQLALSLGLGTRVYFRRPDPMVQLTVELDLPGVTLGLVGARASAVWVDSLFSDEGAPEIPFSSYLGGVALRGQILCVRGEERRLCFEVHGEVGYTRTYSANVDPSLLADDMRGSYLMAALGVEGRMPLGPFEGALRAELGASDGKDVMTRDSYLSAYSGPLAMINLGLRWMP